MSKRSKLLMELRAGLVESARRMTPEERLAAYVNLSGAAGELYMMGKARRARAVKSQEPSTRR